MSEKGFGNDGDVQRDTYILDEAAETVYDRPDQHGDPEDSFAKIAGLWSSYLDTEIEDYEVADLMILLKMARSSEGVYHEDNYVDAAGYAENAARLRNEVDDEDDEDDEGRYECGACYTEFTQSEGEYDPSRIQIMCPSCDMWWNVEGVRL